MKVVIFGASGMIGYGVLRECIDDPGIEAVTTVGRRPVHLEHEKLTQIAHDDFTDFSALEEQLAGFDACMWCLGVSSAGMDEQRYRRITVDYSLAAATLLARKNPSLTFCFISGAGTDRESTRMWARVKAEAEDRLGELPFHALYNFRPALIRPMRGARSKTTSYRIVYAILWPLFPLLQRMRKYVTTTPQLGRAMIWAAREGAPKQTLENVDIRNLADKSEPGA